MTVAPSVVAGGWATAALVNEVGPVTVGEPFSVHYVVRAHGVVGQELDGMETSLAFTNQASSEVIAVSGKETADRKIYEATVMLPSAGKWSWSVAIHNYLPGNDIDSPMPTLIAAAAGETPDVTAGKTSGMTTVVTISDSGFSPATVEIEAGDTVTWVNEGMMVHQVASNVLGFDTSPMIQPGEAYFQTVMDRGTFDYVCPPHPGMVGTVIVS